MNENQEKAALRKEAEKSADELVEEVLCGGFLGCICCACNLVNTCCPALMTPECCHLFHGSRCFVIINSRAKALAWGPRIMGWVMMFVGLYLLFSPLLTLIKTIPFLGPILAKLGGFLIWVMCFILTLALSGVVVSIAYAFYRPIHAMVYGTLAAASIVVPILFIMAL
eukprot:CAMPEP_0168481050 /NCGR_PEP_ID=MMETSP0228-20121227/64312_1 /TAXON_ID=133427 /ORGANISM="Protoceratium reticulatum, Strain CCCM 535 (=CCMP 1889)" /LENGTH=167 /DNA_ID=CAMNT_0008497407 /DNA_START=26 /DNA_END=529 /DNA_ORIENTATION=-